MYNVFISKSAAKELKKLPKTINNRLIPIIKSFKQDPRPANCKKLRGSTNKYRVRSGNYRIIYAVDDEVLIVDIRKVGHRKDIYK